MSQEVVTKHVIRASASISADEDIDLNELLRNASGARFYFTISSASGLNLDPIKLQTTTESDPDPDEWFDVHEFAPLTTDGNYAEYVQGIEFGENSRLSITVVGSCALKIHARIKSRIE